MVKATKTALKQKKTQKNSTAKKVPLRKSSRKNKISPTSIETITLNGDNSENNASSIDDQQTSVSNDVKTKQLMDKYTCILCKKNFADRSVYRAHMQAHRNDENHECQVCKKQFDQTSQLIAHMRQHSIDTETLELFQCNICQTVFSQINQLDDHIHMHFDEMPYICRTCPMAKFWQIENLIGHINGQHGDTTNVYACRYCSQEFDNENEFIEHDEEHSVGKNFDCSDCGEVFQTLIQLNVHKRIHIIDKAYKCTDCGQKFNRSEDLHTHRRIHKGLAVFECQLCERMFAQSKSLSNHVQRVHKDNFHPSELPLIGIVVDSEVKERQVGQIGTNNDVDLGDDDVQQTTTGELFHLDVIGLVKNITNESAPMEEHQENVEQIKRPEETPIKLVEKGIKLITANGVINIDLARKYPCPLCDLMFIKMMTLQMHCKRNHNSSNIAEQLKEIEMRVQKEMTEHVEMIALETTTIDLNQCSSCEHTFPNRTELSEHLRKAHNGNKPYKCNNCQMTFTRSKTLTEHVSIHIAKRHTCKYCAMTFVQSHSMTKHMKRHEGPQLHSCTQCGIPFREMKYLTKHMRTHAEGKPHKCEFCDKRFAQSCDKMKHQRIHTGERPYRCSICNKTFAHLTSIKKHEFVHSGARPHQCTICGKSFQHSSNLVVHMRTHTGERPYKCKLCTKSFYASGHYNDHMKIHQGIQSYKCETCGKGFVHQSSFQKHRRTHSGEKPHLCVLCDRRFSQPGHYKEHMRIHTGEKPYKCQVCAKAFRRSDALQTHMKTHSPTKMRKSKAIASTIAVANENVLIETIAPIPAQANGIKNESVPFMDVGESSLTVVQSNSDHTFNTFSYSFQL